ncbi:STAS domain-containing protein [Veronia pacifica]|uniref:STAS domain-containing protein n=1 Tax=Veronia pacifica TaxID=1080227 RepID=A0A1C3EIW7_9GAMM|nr:STAS domain-containing protein [Veronia pacifica]ODA33173.1 hypothetical protein A8L45_11130 [Veronia pacifica]
MSVSLGEQVDISQVLTLKEAFLNELGEAGNALSVQGGEVVRVDTSGLQLLLAVKRHCEKNNIEWTWESVSDELAHAAGVIGLTEQLAFNGFQ